MPSSLIILGRNQTYPRLISPKLHDSQQATGDGRHYRGNTHLLSNYILMTKVIRGEKSSDSESAFLPTSSLTSLIWPMIHDSWINCSWFTILHNCSVFSIKTSLNLRRTKCFFFFKTALMTTRGRERIQVIWYKERVIPFPPYSTSNRDEILFHQWEGFVRARASVS